MGSEPIICLLTLWDIEILLLRKALIGILFVKGWLLNFFSARCIYLIPNFNYYRLAALTLRDYIWLFGINKGGSAIFGLPNVFPNANI